MRPTRLYLSGRLAPFVVSLTPILVTLAFSFSPSAALAQELGRGEDIPFTSGGKKIALERFRPAGTKESPAILLVPESKSMADVGHVYRAIARRLAKDGYEVAIVHFFDRTGRAGGVEKKDITDNDFKLWLETVSDCFRVVRDFKGVQKDHVGMIGFSLGGFLALSAASDKALNVQAVACYSGGIPDKLWPQVKHLPPTLLIHGTKDEIVPVRDAYAVMGFCKLHNFTYESRIIDEGHLFEYTLKKQVLAILADRALNGQFDLKMATVQAINENKIVNEAVATTLGFFRKHLVETTRENVLEK